MACDVDSNGSTARLTRSQHRQDPAADPPEVVEASCPRMRLAVCRGEPLFADVRVPLSCCNISVTKKFLHCAQIGSAVKKVCRIGMPQCMRVSWGGAPAIENATHIPWSETMATLVCEECITDFNRGRLGPNVDPCTQGIRCWFAEWHTTFFRTLAPHTKRLLREIDCSTIE